MFGDLKHKAKEYTRKKVSQTKLKVKRNLRERAELKEKENAAYKESYRASRINAMRKRGAHEGRESAKPFDFGMGGGFGMPQTQSNFNLNPSMNMGDPFSSGTVRKSPVKKRKPRYEYVRVKVRR